MHHKHIDLGTTRKSIQRYGTGEGRRGDIELTNGDERVGKS